MQRLEVDDLQFFVVVARQIWSRINFFVLGGDFFSPSTVICRAKDRANASFSLSERPYPQQQPQRNLFWVPPSNGVIKINWNAAICKREEKNANGLCCS